MKFKKNNKAYKFFLDARIYYAIALIGIFTWVPMNQVRGKKQTFDEYDWIFNSYMFSTYKINFVYLGFEFLVITILFFLFKKK
jgi:hypothetical protein